MIVPDNFNKVMQGIVRQSAINGGPTISDILAALCASHEDSLESGASLAQAIETIVANNAAEHRAIIVRIEKIVADRAPRRSTDSESFEHWTARDDTAKQTFFMWTLGSKVSYLVMAVVVAVVTAVSIEFISYLSR